MAKYYGIVGYLTSVESPQGSGKWVPKINERRYYGDVIKNHKQTISGDKINDDISINNTISIVADQYAYENFFAIKYIVWMGTKWKVTSVEVQRPRLIFSIGGVYNG